MLCYYGCGQEAKYFLSYVKKWCCSKSQNSCLVNRRKNSEALRKVMKEVRNRPKIKEKTSIMLKESWKKKTLEEVSMIVEKRKNTCLIKYGVESPLQVEQFKEKSKETTKKRYKVENWARTEKWLNYMKNGGAIYSNSFIKNPSKEELELREKFEEVNKNLNFRYKYEHKVLEDKNYTVDIGIFPYKIAIEFDGWFHFSDQEHIEYHKKRQKEIEQSGWKFIRYSIFQPFPTEEQIREDLLNIIKEV